MNAGTKTSVAVFQGYLLEKGKPTDFLSLPVEELNALLKKFYVEARKKDKNSYSKSSLTGIRFGLCRYIKSSRPEVGTEFEESNIAFKAKVVDLKRLGMAKIEHKDIKKLYQSEAFNTATPKRLQNKVFFEVMLFSVEGDRKPTRA